MLFRALIDYQNVFAYIDGNHFNIVRIVRRIDKMHYKTLQVVEVFMKRTDKKLEHYYKLHEAGWKGYGDVELKGYDKEEMSYGNRCIIYTQGTGDDAKQHYFMFIREFNGFSTFPVGIYARATNKTEREFRHSGYLKEGECFHAYSGLQIMHGILMVAFVLFAGIIGACIGCALLCAVVYVVGMILGFLTWLFCVKLYIPTALGRVLAVAVFVTVSYRIYKSWDYGWLCDLRENLGWKKIE